MNTPTEAFDQLSPPSFGASDIEGQLARIFSGPGFANSESLRKFLLHIVHELFAGRADEIKAYSIATCAFGRPATFDPQADPIVRIQAGRLRRALDRYYETDGREDPVHISIPKGRYVPLITSNPRSGPDTTGLGESVIRNAASLRPPRVAIVELENTSRDSSGQHLATGLAQDLVSSLSRFDTLIPVGPLLRGRISELGDGGAHEIAQRYEADFVLHGRLHEDHESFRITLDLVETCSRETLWSEGFRSGLDAADRFAFRDKVVHQVAAALGAGDGFLTSALTHRIRGQSPGGLSAYEASLKAYHWGIVSTTESFQEATAALEHAVEVHPGDALSKAMLADICCVDHFCNTGMFPRPVERAESLIREALALDPNCREALWVRGSVHFVCGSRHHALRAFETGVSANANNPRALAASGFFLAPLGRWEEGLALSEEAMELNPHHPSWYHFIPALYHYREGNIEKALRHALSIDVPGFFWAAALSTVVFEANELHSESANGVDALLNLQPSFATEGREIMRRYMLDERLLERMITDLRRAGLALQ